MTKEKTYHVSLFDIWMEHSEHKEMHRHDFHEIFLNVDGDGEQYTPEGDIRMKKEDIFFFPASIDHIGNGAPGGHCLGGVINLDEKLFLGENDLFPESKAVLKALTREGKKGHYRINVNPSGRKKLFSIFYEMLTEIREKRPGFRTAVNALMHQFLIIILRNSQLDIQEKGDRQPVSFDKIKDTINFLETHFFDQVDIDHAAHMSNMSRSHFHAVFKQITGKTYIEFLNNLRVKHADKLLKTTDLEIEAIAFRSGFTSVSHFYKVFKETTGTTPKKIRSQKHKFIM